MINWICFSPKNSTYTENTLKNTNDNRREWNDHGTICRIIFKSMICKIDIYKNKTYKSEIGYFVGF